MKEETDKLTKTDLKKFTFSAVSLFVILVLPKLNLLNLWTKILDILSFNSNFYNFKDPAIFFSVGEAISALAILLAIYQIKKEKWNLSLKIRGYITKVILVTISLGILFSIISSLVIFITPKYVFHLSIFWQILSSIFIAFSVIFLLTKATNKNLFNKKNSRKFYEIIAWEISRPDKKRLNYALDVILDNFENICKSAVISDSKMEISQSARNILNVILSDESIVKLITTERFDGLMYIISTLKKYNISRNHSNRGIPIIFRGLFFYQDSFLYKQLDYEGIAMAANIYENVFGSSQMLNNFDIFGYPTIGFASRIKSDKKTVDVFIDALSKSIETYLINGDVSVSHINNGIECLSNIFGNLCERIAEEEGDGKIKYDIDSNWWSLSRISTFWSHTYVFMGVNDGYRNNDVKLNKEIIEREEKAQEASFNSNRAINEAVAAALYKCFEQLSKIKKAEDTYHIVLDLLGGIISEPEYKKGYSKPFTKRIWEQIGKNVLGKYYPAVLRPYLNYIGLAVASNKNQETGWRGEQSERMRRLLYIDLKPLLDNNTKMVNDEFMKDVLLPECMDYKDGKFTYTMGFGKGPTVEIDLPPEGSESALKGVDWEHSRSLL
jgi:hypothetical protein